MTRGVVIFLLCFMLQGGLFNRADAATTGNFDAATAAQVWTVALAYIAPRSLQKMTIPQMTLWGLNGLTASTPTSTPRCRTGNCACTGPIR